MRRVGDNVMPVGFLGLLCSPFATQGRSYRRPRIAMGTRVPVGAALRRERAAKGPRNQGIKAA